MIELTLKFKDPKVDGLPKESCRCIVFTDTSHFQEVYFSAVHNLFNCIDSYTAKEAEVNAIKNVVYYTEISFNDNKTLSAMNSVAYKVWFKRNGYEE